ncbi:SDR family oxidoreductase [Methylocaldum gracile]|jgi:3-oxoacyl-[acyl-carrier protein] reductase|nr:SDR family oxidoreductase [Methylocaldum sp. BRCS4]
MVSHPRIWLLGRETYAGALADMLAAQGATVHHSEESDATNAESATERLERSAEAAHAALGGIDALVFLDRMRQASAEPDPDRVLTETITASQRLFLAVRALAPRMAKDGVEGNVIVICDDAASSGREGFLAGSAAGGALIGMSKCLAKELGRYRIAVNVLCHGFIEGIDTGVQLTVHEQMLFKVMGLARHGNPGHLAANILHLARGGHWMTGQVLRVDDGLII